MHLALCLNRSYAGNDITLFVGKLHLEIFLYNILYIPINTRQLRVTALLIALQNESCYNNIKSINLYKSLNYHVIKLTIHLIRHKQTVSLT